MGELNIKLIINEKSQLLGSFNQNGFKVSDLPRLIVELNLMAEQLKQNYLDKRNNLGSYTKKN